MGYAAKKSYNYANSVYHSEMTQGNSRVCACFHYVPPATGRVSSSNCQSPEFSPGRSLILRGELRQLVDHSTPVAVFEKLSRPSLVLDLQFREVGIIRTGTSDD